MAEMKLVMYTDFSAGDCFGFLNPADKEYVIIDDNSDAKNVDTFLFDLFANVCLREDLLTDEEFNDADAVLKTVLDNLSEEDEVILNNASMKFFDGTIEIGDGDEGDYLDSYYQNLLCNLDWAKEYCPYYMQLSICTGMYYVDENTIRVVDFDFDEMFYDAYGRYRGYEEINYDEMTDIMYKKYGCQYMDFKPEEIVAGLEDAIEAYDIFINKTIRKRLNELSTTYGDKLADAIYKKSNWKNDR